MLSITKKGEWCTAHDELIKPGEPFSRESDGAVLCMDCKRMLDAGCLPELAAEIETAKKEGLKVIQETLF